jgi:peptidoglycan/LPS O-acetylase OafA/YrhL
MTIPLQPRRLHYLDAARGIAVWLTILLHLQYAGWFGFNSSSLAKFPYRLLWDGNLAILFFFVHSGFILTYRLQQEYREPGLRNASVYYMRRILRLYPGYLTCLLLVFVFRHFSANPAFTLSESEWLRQYWQQTPAWSDLAGQALLAVRLPNDPDLRLLPNDWTLTIECLASAILPLMAWGFRRAPFLLPLLTWLLVQLQWLDPFLLDFSLGVTLALYYDRIGAPVERIGLIDAVLFLLAGCCWLTVEHFPAAGENFARTWLVHPKGWSAAIIFLILLRLRSLQRWLNRSFLILNGRVSYSLYLVHLPWLFLLWSDGFAHWNFGLRVLLFFLGTILFAWLLHRFIERPALELGRKWTNILQNRTTRPS